MRNIALAALMTAAPAASPAQAPSAIEPLVAGAFTPYVSVSPVVLSAPGRGLDLEVRVSAPVTGRHLPIIIFSHGNGWSLDGYGPLVHFWASHGFIVVQPTHLDSRALRLDPDDPRRPLIWRYRVNDMKRILDNLDRLEASVPGLKGRADRTRIAAVGHSYGGHTTALLLGARVIGRDRRIGEDLSDPRIKVGVLITPSGKGGGDLSPFAAEHYPFLDVSFGEMTGRALVVVGDKDQSRLSVRGPDWSTDAYHLSPGADCLATLFGGEHLLGGISGFEVKETTDENPDRVAAVQRISWAYLRTALYPGDPAWAAMSAALKAAAKPQGRIDCK
jgi:hypothetical protein